MDVEFLHSIRTPDHPLNNTTVMLAFWSYPFLRSTTRPTVRPTIGNFLNSLELSFDALDRSDRF